MGMGMGSGMGMGCSADTVNSNDEVEPIRVVIAGGDGTIMWGMMELGNHDISPDDIVVAALPLGTGKYQCVDRDRYRLIYTYAIIF